jgi:hypothetical protein
MEIVVLSKDELETLLRRVADAAVEQLRSDLAAGNVRELMNISQLSDYLGRHRSTISKYMNDGMPHEICGDQPVFRKTDIDLWLKGEYESNSCTKYRAGLRNH